MRAGLFFIPGDLAAVDVRGLIEAALGHTDAEPAAVPQGWQGLWLDETNGLILRTVVADGGVTLHYATTPTRLRIGADGVARGKGISLERQGAAMVMRRMDENRVITVQPLQPSDRADITGVAGNYWSDELQASLQLGGGDGAAHAGFEGMLGRGPVERMYPAAQDVWIIPTRRAMDASPPGDWTLRVQRTDGVVTGVTLGCWLARDITYAKV